MVEGGGFEPPKSMTTDLQSVPFGRSGIPPDEEPLFTTGADDGTRTRNLLITSQLLYQLSYASLITIRSVPHLNPAVQSESLFYWKSNSKSTSFLFQ
jgi:hypothetical protein